MEKQIISKSHKLKNFVLDDCYTLYNDGTILHEYDKHTYPGGQNLCEHLTIANLSDNVKQRLLNSASNKEKEFVRKVLNLDIE
jgi:hypothetical protein